MDRVRKERELVVVAENKVGVLHEISMRLSKAGINIDSIFAYVTDWEAVFRLITSDQETARKEIMKIPYVKEIDTEDVVVVRLEDKPGSLANLMEKLRRLNVDINITYIMYRDGKYTDVALRPSEITVEALLNLLKTNFK
ncbi:MAG: ACT domain-containing protein [Candidatus Micrarchaeota archaeon]|nr:ACT domain-containing protein [Candidatus Micrarchaeota archaeon]MCX8154254.1 ACT domain-containing protein [Candidatus Micrarchaeota archaeon]